MVKNEFIQTEKIDNVHLFVYHIAEVKHRMNITQEDLSGLWAFWQDKRLPSSLILRMLMYCIVWQYAQPRLMDQNKCR